MDLKSNLVRQETYAFRTNTSNRVNRSLISTLLYFIKRCKPKPLRNQQKPKLGKDEASDVCEDIEEWNKKYISMEAMASKLIAQNEKVVEDNHLLRLELKRVR